MAQAAAQATEVLTLTARGGPLEQEFAFGVVRQLLERHLSDAEGPRRAELLDGPAALVAPAVGTNPTDEPSPADATFSICHGLYWLTVNLTAERPLVLIVDDLHWADTPSVRGLLHLAARLDGLPVLIVAGRRTGEPSPDPQLLDELQQLATAVLHPAPLREEAVATLIDERLGASSPQLVAAAHEATGGNPFLLHELLRALRADQQPGTDIRPERLQRLGLQNVARSLLLRLSRLPQGSAAVARAIAVLTTHAEPRHVAALTGLQEAAVGEATDALVAADILASGRPHTFAHPTVRAAVYDDIPASDRSRLHAAAAAVLQRTGRTAGEIAPHLLVAEPTGDHRTVACLRAAAAQALSQGAPELAQRHLRRALAEPPDEDTMPALLGELGDAEWLAGEDPAAATEHLAAALERTTDPTDRLTRALALHRALFSTGQINEAVALLEQEMQRHPDDANPESLMRVEAELASIGLLHPSTVSKASARLAPFEELSGTTPAELLQLANVACWKWAQGTAEETVHFGRRSLADARIQAAEATDAMPIYEALWALAHTDELQLAGTVLDETLADARDRGSVFGISTSCALLALIAVRRGDTATAEAEARTGAGLPGLSDFVRPPLFGYLTLALVARGDLEEAETAIAQSGCGPDLPEFVCLNPVFGARGTLRLAQDRPEEALADFRELGERSQRVQLRNPVEAWRIGAARALIRLGRRDEAILLAEEQLDLARAWGTTSAIGTAMRGHALAHDATPAAFAAAAEMLSRSPARLEQARCLIDLGAALRHANRRIEAREPLREGLELARRCGATPLVERAHQELLVAGARPRRLMFSGQESLTPSERRVAELAASGRTNRDIAQLLFVTPKTVENQLGRAYIKLGISSRGALSQALGVTPPPTAVARPS